MSDVYQSLAHSKWDCKYHVVFVPKRRRKAIFGPIRSQLGAIFHALAKQKECQILEGHLMPDHVHMCIAKGEEFLGCTFLGARLRGVHGRFRVGAGETIYPRAGSRGWQ